MNAFDTNRKVQFFQVDIKQEIFLNAENEVKKEAAKFEPEPIGDDFKPKFELKKEDTMAFKKGIEETLKLEIKADLEPISDDLKPKVELKKEKKCL